MKILFPYNPAKSKLRPPVPMCAYKSRQGTLCSRKAVAGDCWCQLHQNPLHRAHKGPLGETKP